MQAASGRSSLQSGTRPGARTRGCWIRQSVPSSTMALSSGGLKGRAGLGRSSGDLCVDTFLEALATEVGKVNREVTRSTKKKKKKGGDPAPAHEQAKRFFKPKIAFVWSDAASNVAA